ncbi:unnamed protein product [Trifolium pratense]|uniref:Uncharacterized protein n=1 Tax=Trifolium pratense TaxID=57577 RepID=A0ACB0IG23_TRIPR|nr:unnamed protein product [Trifolium pratense]
MNFPNCEFDDGKRKVAETYYTYQNKSNRISKELQERIKHVSMHNINARLLPLCCVRFYGNTMTSLFFLLFF